MRIEFSDGVNIHKVEVLGYGQQYVLTGTHPSGSLYSWEEGRELVNCGVEGLTRRDVLAFAKFMDALRQEIDTRGWVVKTQTQAHGAGNSVSFDVDRLEPLVAPELALAALNAIPNTPDTLPTRDDFVKICAAFKANLGKFAEDHREAFYDWATKHGWADREWVDGIWPTLTTVRTNPQHLFSVAHRFGFVADAVTDFDDEAPTVPEGMPLGPLPQKRKSGKGSNLDAVLRRLEEEPRWQGVFGYDEFRQCVMVLNHIPTADHRRPNEPFAPRPLQDEDAIRAKLWLQRAAGFSQAKDADVRQAIDLLARQNRFHPVRDYLGGLVWDGVERLSTWLKDHAGAVVGADVLHGDVYLEAVSRASLIGAVARVMDPGCQLDTVLVVEGEQGVGKSSLICELCPQGDWHSSSMPQLNTKDARLHLHGKWIIELAELAAMSRSEVEQTKAFITERHDAVRPPYGRETVSYPRQVAFFATTNAAEYIRDDTGGRRFLPVRMTKQLDVATFRQVRDQLWAEAVAARKAGEGWHLSGNALAAARAAQGGRTVSDSLDEPVLDAARCIAREQQGPVTVHAILEAMGVAVGQRATGLTGRVTGALRRAGWSDHQIRIGGPTKRIWWSAEFGEMPIESWREAACRTEQEKEWRASVARAAVEDTSCN